MPDLHSIIPNFPSLPPYQEQPRAEIGHLA